jgi:hypothetical protein
MSDRQQEQAKKDTLKEDSNSVIRDEESLDETPSKAEKVVQQGEESSAQQVFSTSGSNNARASLSKMEHRIMNKTCNAEERSTGNSSKMDIVARSKSLRSSVDDQNSQPSTHLGGKQGDQNAPCLVPGAYAIGSATEQEQPLSVVSHSMSQVQDLEQVDIEEENPTGTAVVQQHRPSSILATAWEVQIDSPDEETSTLVLAEPSSEEKLRRWNKRLVYLVGFLLLAAIVVGTLLGVLLKPANDSSTTTSSEPTTPPTSAPGPALPPVAWSHKGQVLEGNASLDEYGNAVALDATGNIVAVGAWGAQGWAGQVQVMQFSNSTWVPMGSILTGRLEGNQLGVSVSLSATGSTLVTGANQYNLGDFTNRTGLVRVFRFENGDWRQVGPDIKGIDDGDQFGWKVDVSGDGTIVAAAARQHGNRTGLVQVYTLHINETWKLLGDTLTGEAAGDQFGTSLALSQDGRTLAVGSDEHDATGLNAGRVRVFSYTNQVWQQLGQSIDALEAKDDFGYSLALSSDGTVLAIGAWEHAETLGYVRVFKKDDNEVWQPMGSTIYGDAVGSQFGISVDISDDANVLIVGANEYNFGQQDLPGRAYVYRFDGSNWQRVSILVGDAPDDRFGWSVAMSADGSVVAVSAYRNDENGDQAGQVQILQVEEE